MNVLVTGADGLLGNNLVRELIAQGYQVRVLLLSESSASVLSGLDVRRYHADISVNSSEIDEATKNCSAVFHCAAITDLNASYDLMEKVNVEGTRNIIESCIKNNVNRLVFVGSASSFQFGDLSNQASTTNSDSTKYKNFFEKGYFLNSKTPKKG